MNETNVTRNIKLDILKAMAIFLVIFYHFGIVEFGYLGVDIFLVVNGFLIGKSLKKKNDEFTYFGFILKKIKQFWPLLLISGIISLGIGFVLMLPDDYENLVESIIATNFFSNNVLALVTTKDYWNVVNDFKPLMHTWYMGILLQSYFVIGIIPVISEKISKKYSNTINNIIFLVLFILSLLLYVLPIFGNSIKFYFLPFRLFEILGGLLIAFNLDSIQKYFKYNKKTVLFEVLMLIVLFLLVFLKCFEFKSARLLLICVTTSFLILCSSIHDLNKTFFTSIIAYFGRISYSLFVWHQILLAFIRYSFKTKFLWSDYLLIFILMILISIFSYELLEKKMKKMKSKSLWVVSALLCIISTSLSLLIYMNAGVVRDIPELDIKINEAHRHMHAEYNDRGYKYDKEFENDNKIKVLVIGDSFGRDWINIMLESDISDKIDISYIYTGNINEKKLFLRMEKSNFIFYAVCDKDLKELPNYLNEYYDKRYSIYYR